MCQGDFSFFLIEIGLVRDGGRKGLTRSGENEWGLKINTGAGRPNEGEFDRGPKDYSTSLFDPLGRFI